MRLAQFKLTSLTDMLPGARLRKAGPDQERPWKDHSFGKFLVGRIASLRRHREAALAAVAIQRSVWIASLRSQ
jgi:hypothetical protein